MKGLLVFSSGENKGHNAFLIFSFLVSLLKEKEKVISCAYVEQQDKL